MLDYINYYNDNNKDVAECQLTIRNSIINKIRTHTPSSTLIVTYSPTIFITSFVLSNIFSTLLIYRKHISYIYHYLTFDFLRLQKKIANKLNTRIGGNRKIQRI